MTKVSPPMTAALALIASACAAQPALAQPADPSTPRLLSAGMEHLCSEFLAKPAAKPDAIEAMAADAGFKSGAQGKYGPVGQAIPGAPPALAFHADTGPAAGGPEVEVFLTTVPRACQLRVMGDAGGWGELVSQMKRQGATLMTTAPVTHETTYSHEVYVGGVAGLPPDYTTFASHWIGQGAPKTGVWTFINVLPNTGVGG
ncbi:MAG TPA: hypothetical protein VGG92_19770 [Caulobacteraceae bacterium]|jgi:hypothetical protein